jgi:D-3-phosphoglycerate dehydrogenase
MTKIVKTDGMLEVGPSQLECLDGLGAEFVDRACLTEVELVEACADADGILVLREPVTAKVIAGLDRCKVISRFGVGLDSIDVAAATEAGIVVTNVPDSNTDEVATHAIAMVMALTRRLNEFDRSVRSGSWDALGVGRGIRRFDRLVLGLVGLGRIGRLVAERARALGLQVCAYDPQLSPEQVRGLGVEPVGLDDLISGADVVSLHVPLTEETAGLLDRGRIGRMKPGAIVINVSRGGLIDEGALADALISGHLAGAGLDAFAEEPAAPQHPLLGLPQVLLSPHAAHYSEQSYEEVRTKAFADLAAVLRGEPPRYPVN